MISGLNPITIVSRKVDKHACPACGAVWNAVTTVGVGKPQDGDISVCSKCVSPSKFVPAQDGLVLVALTEEDWKSLGAANVAKLRLYQNVVRNRNQKK